MDTWATSSLTPQIAGGWEEDPDLFERVFPMDLCTNAHDIIRTWLFSRVVRAHFENHAAPWSHAMISGFIVDPDRKKMSKSKGNVVVPHEILDKYGADAVRWRAAMARPGLDSPFDETQMKVGRRLAMKVLNVSKFVLGSVRATSVEPGLVTEAVDRALLGQARRTRSRRRPEPSQPTTTRPRWSRPRSSSGTSATTTSSWSRSGPTATTGPPADRPPPSAKAALATALHVQLRMFAPFLPYATEEVWSWWQRARSTCRPGPPPRTSASPRRRPRRARRRRAVLAGVRGAKSTAKVGMRTPVEHATDHRPGRRAGRHPQRRERPARRRLDHR